MQSSCQRVGGNKGGKFTLLPPLSKGVIMYQVIKCCPKCNKEMTQFVSANRMALTYSYKCFWCGYSESVETITTTSSADKDPVWIEGERDAKE